MHTVVAKGKRLLESLLHLHSENHFLCHIKSGCAGTVIDTHIMKPKAPDFPTTAGYVKSAL